LAEFYVYTLCTAHIHRRSGKTCVGLAADARPPGADAAGL
jgi:hypothetical protein